jgi:hypothetical protein
MPKRSCTEKLSNNRSELHNLYDSSDLSDYDTYRENYLFMKQSPLYTHLEQKYKQLKKQCREQVRMIQLLQRQHIDILERAVRSELLSSTMHSEPARVDQVVSENAPTSLPESQVFIKQEHVPENTYLNADVDENTVLVIEYDPEVVILDSLEKPVEQIAVEEAEVEVVDEEEEEEEEVKVEVVEEEEEEDEEEEVEVVEEEEEEDEEVKVEEVVEEEEEEVEVVEEEEVEVEVVEEEEVEVEVVEEEEVEVEVVEEEEVEVEVVEEEEEEVEVVEEEEEGVYEYTINGKQYYITNHMNGAIYEIVDNEEVGEQVGHYENGIPKFD